MDGLAGGAVYDQECAVTERIRRGRMFREMARGAHEHMARDVRLAEEAEAALRLFTWSVPALSLGWKQPRPDWMDAERLRREGVDWVERPTGGGLALHGSDLSCSVVEPHASGRSIRQLMAGLCGFVGDLCQQLGLQTDTVLELTARERITVCLTDPSEYAVLTRNRKVAGFAVRRFHRSWLVQGSMLVQPLPEGLRRVLPVPILTRLSERAVSLSEAAGRGVDVEDVIDLWQACWSMEDIGCAV